jgi:hypothetical protein
LAQAPELLILAEIRENESAELKGQLHSSDVPTSLLQVDAEQSQLAAIPMEAAQALAKSLAASFDEITQEQNKSTVILKAQFETQFAQLKLRHDTLLAEQDSLNKTRDGLLDIHKRLELADRHLTNVTVNFEEHAIALRGFLEGTWKRNAPEGIVDVPNSDDAKGVVQVTQGQRQLLVVKATPKAKISQKRSGGKSKKHLLKRKTKRHYKKVS